MSKIAKDEVPAAEVEFALGCRYQEHTGYKHYLSILMLEVCFQLGNVHA